jgi:signal transduction histidine kinase
MLMLLFGESKEDLDGWSVAFVEDVSSKSGFVDRRHRALPDGKKRDGHIRSARNERRRATDLVAVLRKRLNTATGRLLLSQQLERDRIAAEIHDGLGQTLSLLSLEIDGLCDESSRADLSASQMRLRKYVQQSLIELRQTMRNLKPAVLDSNSLTGALDLLCMDFRASSPGVRLDCQFSESVNRLPEKFAIAAYRIAQEALNNVAKHAHASAVLVSFTIDDFQVELLIHDDGKGLPQQLPSGGFGLKTMQERAHSSGGRITIESDPDDGGCVVRTCWMLQAVG